MIFYIEVWQNFQNFGLLGIEDCIRIINTDCERLSSLDKNIFV